jgi:hypothetical protein
MKAADFRRLYREARRTTEWRFSFAIWGLMAAIAAAMTRVTISPYWVLGAVAVITALHIAWVRDNFLANQRDADLMWDDYNEARKVMGLPPQGPPEPKKEPGKRKRITDHPPSIGAILVTIAIAGLVAAFAFLAAPKSPTSP